MTTAAAISKSSSLDVSSFLVAKGVQLLYCEPDETGKRVRVVFACSPEQMAALEASFYSGAQVSAVSLLNAFRQVRRSMDLLLRKEPPRATGR